MNMAENPREDSAPRGSLFIVSGPSGSGKTSLCQLALRDLSGIRFSVSYTTRPPRPNEIHGQDYFFVSEGLFHQMASAGEFLEWAKVYGNYYGTGRGFVEEVLRAGTDVLLDIDVQGAMQVKERMPGAIATLVFPPDFLTLRKRLESRALDRREVICGRLEIARTELLRYRQYDYLIVNDDLAVAGHELKAIITASRLEVRHRSGVAEKILTSFEIPLD
jgi:guanylate kinase